MDLLEGGILKTQNYLQFGNQLWEGTLEFWN